MIIGYQTLSEVLIRSRAPGLDAVRLAAAVAVIVSHAWPLSMGAGATEPLEELFGVSLGHLAVLIFFFVSGVLISESAHRKCDRKMDFVIARARRIFPGLLMALLVTCLLAGLFGSTADGSELSRYVAKGLSLVSIEHQISGAFANNPFPLIVNGPLWTLCYEVLCYVIVAAVIWSQILKNDVQWICALAALMCMLILRGAEVVPGGAIGYRLTVFLPLAWSFFLGATAWRFRDRLGLRLDAAFLGLISGATIAAAFGSGSISSAVFAAVLGYFVLVVGCHPKSPAMGADISYGCYIYGWPVGQCLVAILGDVPPVQLALINVIAVVPFAYLSWTYVERPSLRRITSNRQQA